MAEYGFVCITGTIFHGFDMGLYCGGESSLDIWWFVKADSLLGTDSLPGLIYFLV